MIGMAAFIGMQIVSLLLIDAIWESATGFSISRFLPDGSGENQKQFIGIFRWIQGLHLFLSFAVPAFIWAKAEGGNPFRRLAFQTKVSPAAYLLGAVAISSAIPFIETIQFDAESFRLGEGLESLEKMIREMEDKTFGMVKALLEDSSLSALLSNVIVIALVPAVAEELFFRGFLLHTLKRMMGLHLTVWVTAFIFSFLHFQFFGFFPRMFLGAILGYLVIWSGSLLPAILAHFMNNFLSVLGVWVNSWQSGGEAEITAQAHFPGWVAILSLMTSAILLLLYRRQFVKPPDNQALG